MPPIAPRVSVVIPARNAAATLEAALTSVRRQSLVDFECIVVDDGSTDATSAIVQRFARLDRRFRVLCRPPRGLVHALNDALANARAPWVARMDADDIMLKRRLELQLGHVSQDRSLTGVGTHVRLFPRDRLSDGRRRYESWLNSLCGPEEVYRDRFVECPLAHPTWFMRTSALAELGYRELAAPEDYDLLLRLFSRGHRLASVPRRLLLWRDHAGRLSRVDERYHEARFTWLKALHLSESFLAGFAKYVLWGYGGTGKALSEALAERGHQPSYIVEVHPGRLGQTIRNAQVIEPAALRLIPKLPLVVSVAGAIPRTQIRQALAGMGFIESSDFVCAA